MKFVKEIFSNDTVRIYIKVIRYDVKLMRNVFIAQIQFYHCSAQRTYGVSSDAFYLNGVYLIDRRFVYDL